MRRPSKLRRAGGPRFLAGAALGAALSLAALPAAGTAPDGDAARGAELYQRCLACHAVDRNRVGPRHCGIKGRKAGGVRNYAYSKAFRDLDVVWAHRTLDAFLATPMDFAPGTKMTYDGVKNDRDRADLVAYLLSLAPCD